jgi:hypothetical protein
MAIYLFIYLQSVELIISLHWFKTSKSTWQLANKALDGTCPPYLFGSDDHDDVDAPNSKHVVQKFSCRSSIHHQRACSWPSPVHGLCRMHTTRTWREIAQPMEKSSSHNKLFKKTEKHTQQAHHILYIWHRLLYFSQSRM